VDQEIIETDKTGEAPLRPYDAGDQRGKLDMARVQRWAELLDGDAQARQFMRERLAGGELSQLSALSLRNRRLELALKHGIPAPLADVHLTADDPQLLEQQAESLAALLANTSGGTGPRAGQGFSGGYVDGVFETESRQARGPVPPNITPHVNPLPAYEAAPVNREEWLEQQFVRMYEH
jgi:hypothetical protein